MWSLEQRGAIHRETMRLNAERYRLEQQARGARRDRAQPDTARFRLRLPAWLRSTRPSEPCPRQLQDMV